MSAPPFPPGPWALLPERLLALHAAWPPAAAAPGSQQDVPVAMYDGVAVVPVEGLLLKRDSLIGRLMGATSSEQLGQVVDGLAARDDVTGIVLKIDSPGGEVDGTQVLAAKVHAASLRKPVVAFADGLMASAAYWVGSAADEIIAAGPTTQVGSIGIAAAHVDMSRREEMLGFKTTEITAGKFKRIASPYAPLSDAGRAAIQAQVDQLYSIFVNDVARYRVRPVNVVLQEMADGRVFLGEAALTWGLVDRPVPFERVVHEMRHGVTPTQRRGRSEALSGMVSAVAAQRLLGISFRDSPRRSYRPR